MPLCPQYLPWNVVKTRHFLLLDFVLLRGPSYTVCGIISSCVSLEHPIPSLWSSGIHTHDVFSGTLRVNPG